MQIFSDKSFENPIQTITAFNTIELRSAFDLIEKLKSSHYILMYMRYEARNCFLGSYVQSELPLLYAEVYDQYKPYKANEMRPLTLTSQSDIFYDEYADALNAIHEEIALGNTYEVNYTYDFNVEYKGEDLLLYENLLTKQKTPYNAFIKNQWDTVLSFSPELFFKIEGTHIITKPMKGTVRRGLTQNEDDTLKKFLQNDIKNRAENVMIVDLLRNDLGRIAKTNSVNVTKLFEIETHPTVHQMTSQIEADLLEKSSLYDVFKALFPCGSITGAPKISTMKIIERLEKGKRNIYCGALGLVSPHETVFSVPIRILQKEKKSPVWKYRVGGAIVWDSTIEDEWRETITKAQILNSSFALIETIKAKNKKIFFLDEHLERLGNSAEYFKYGSKHSLNDTFTVMRNKIKNDLFKFGESDVMIRILLSKNGEYSIEYKQIISSPTNKVRISPLSVESNNIYLYHKTTVRPYYHVDYTKYYDELFFNERGELTEGSRTNIVVEINGPDGKSELLTPPLSCGLLNGIMRAKMLDEAECIEKIITKEDLRKASHIYCVNSVRGKQEVTLEQF